MTRNLALLTPFICVLGVLGLTQPAPAGMEPGVLVRLYDVSEPMHLLPEIAPGEKPNVVRVLPGLDLRTEQGAFAPLEDNFITEVVGLLKIEQAGTYTFRLLSDDGSRLWLDGVVVVDHDGPHGPEPKDGTIELKAGMHRLRVLHFEAGGGEQLTVQWRLPGAAEEAEFAAIPPGALFHDSDESRAASPGKKRVVHPLRRGLPGDGSPVIGMHPGFVAELEGEAPYQMIPPPELPGLRLQARLRPHTVGSFILLRPEPAATGLVSWAALNDPPYASQVEHELQLAAAVAGQPGLQRVFAERIDGVTQGCVFRMAQDVPGTIRGVQRTTRGLVVLASDLPVTEEQPEGKGRVRMALSDHAVFELMAVRSEANGFELEFSHPLDPRVGWDPDDYYVEQWPFDPEAGVGPLRDGTSIPVKSASVSPDRTRVFLELEGLRPASMVYLRLLPPCVSADGDLPWSTEAWYTLLTLPTERKGKALPRPSGKPQNVLSAEERAAGWKLLFDGKSTDQWLGYGKDSFPAEGWQVRDGCIVRVGPGGDIMTREEFTDFELALEWRICPGGNSGIFYRVDGSLPYAWASGPEMQVLDNREHYDGANTKTSAGSNYALHAPVRDVTVPVGFFNQARILVQGNHVEHWLNGVKVVEYELGGPEWKELVAASKFKSMPHYGQSPKGHIVLQDHGDRVWYRDIKIRPITE